MNRRSILASLVTGAAAAASYRTTALAATGGDSTAEKPADSATADAAPAWPPLNWTRIVACRFRTMEDRDHPSGQFSAISAISAISGGKVQREDLAKRALATGVLTKEQQTELLRAASFESHKSMTGFGCYDPHHIFLFFDQENAIVGALEICFQCIGARYLPHYAGTGLPDFRAFAKLCEDLVGLSESAAGFSRRMDKLEDPK